MKSMMILGAITGFILGAVGSVTGECTGPTVLWHACVSALAAGILARWCGRIWFTSLANAMEEQRRARAQASDKKTIAKV
jgi:hypothetical protein